MATAIRQFGLVVVGSGPAGLAPLLAAHRLGNLDQILDDGVALVEGTQRLGSGTIGKYTINSDSSGTTFADCLRSPEQTPLTDLASHPLAKLVAGAGDGTVPLRLAGQFLGLVGETLGRMIAGRPGCEVLMQHTAMSVQRSGAQWRVKLRTLDGRERVLLARNVVLATGGHQPLDRLANECVGGRNLVQHYQAKLLQSDDVLDAGGLELCDRPAERQPPATRGGDRRIHQRRFCRLRAAQPAARRNIRQGRRDVAAPSRAAHFLP